jgi:ABC-2 type transport system permease protein
MNGRQADGVTVDKPDGVGGSQPGSVGWAEPNRVSRGRLSGVSGDGPGGVSGRQPGGVSGRRLGAVSGHGPGGVSGRGTDGIGQIAVGATPRGGWHGLADLATLTGRMLKHNVRSVDTIMTTLGMPLMILLAFVFVLGGAMDTGPVRYVDFVVPVFLVFAVASGVAYTAFRVNQDVSTGIWSRFRTMPIARGALTGGHLAASVAVNAASVAVLVGCAFLVGYRPTATWAGWGLTAVLLLAAIVAFSVMGVACGLAAKTVEGASMFTYPLMALLFVSSGFAPTDTMPGPLRAFADHQPMTPLIDAIRGAQLGRIDVAATWTALAWMAGFVAVFWALASRAARRRTTA